MFASLRAPVCVRSEVASSGAIFPERGCERTPSPSSFPLVTEAELRGVRLLAGNRRAGTASTVQLPVTAENGLPLSARRVNRSSLELPHSPVGRIVQSTPKVSPRRAPLATERSAPRFPREPGHLRICEAAPQLDTQSMMFSSTLESGLRLRNGAFPASASVDQPRASLLQICEQGTAAEPSLSSSRGTVLAGFESPSQGRFRTAASSCVAPLQELARCWSSRHTSRGPVDQGLLAVREDTGANEVSKSSRKSVLQASADVPDSDSGYEVAAIVAALRSNLLSVDEGGSKTSTATLRQSRRNGPDVSEEDENWATPSPSFQRVPKQVQHGSVSRDFSPSCVADIGSECVARTPSSVLLPEVSPVRSPAGPCILKTSSSSPRCSTCWRETHSQETSTTTSGASSSSSGSQVGQASTTDVGELTRKGGEYFQSGRFAQAAQSYSRALAIEPCNSAVLSSRSAARMKMGAWESAHEDASAAALHDVWNARAHERCARCFLLLDRIAEGVEFCTARLASLTEQQRQTGDWALLAATRQKLDTVGQSLRHIEAGLLSDTRTRGGEQVARNILEGATAILSTLAEKETKAPLGRRLRLCKVRAWLLPMAGLSGQPEETRTQWAEQALEEAASLMSECKTEDVRLWYARCLLRKARRSDARIALQPLVASGHTKGQELLDTLREIDKQKDEGNAAFKNLDWEAALQCYDAAVEADKLRLDADFTAALHCNRGATRHKLAQHQLALEDVNVALAITPSYAKALFRRGMLHMDLERYESAANDFDAVARVSPGFVGLVEYRRRAHRWARRPPAKNYYALLGVGFDVSGSELKKAYKAAALRCHPDKNVDQCNAAREFKDVQNAFDTLSDEQKRKEYDDLDGRGGSLWVGGPAAMSFRPSTKARSFDVQGSSCS